MAHRIKDVRKRLFLWVGVLVLLPLAAVSLGLPYLDRQAADASVRQGRALVNEKKYPEAIEAFNRAIEISPNYAPAYHGRGVA
jgi:Flp pilus assembly protein TadD